MNSVHRTLRFAALLTAAVLVFAGCTSKDTTKKTEADKKGAKGHDDHPEKGPHGGALAELGDKEEYHAEFVADKAKKQATVYILDGKAKKAVPIKVKEITLTLKGEKPPVQVKLTADPQKDDKDGASRFVGTHDKFGGDLDPDEVEVSVAVVEGKPPMVGTFEAHGHGHKHGKK